ncbi:ATP-dependent zinc metalloprotease FtsH [Thermoleophilum album]|jgi:cell division protease FtsH|uniref:ATP-dependent zinc metalloprotease FtsH n=1 Tax=Thermoleophilum album TaxID=29539 RepID=UPI00237C8EB2|nr:ATP-dependent zinc metalloprotease FtsH [Thermoleophilum album]
MAGGRDDSAQGRDSAMTGAPSAAGSPPSSRTAAPPARPPDPRTPLPPGPRGGPGWRVAPAPDGRGGERHPRPPMVPFPLGRFLAVLAALLALNFVLANALTAPAPRVRVPYSPFFLQQLERGNVRAISAQGEALKGELKHPVRARIEGERVTVERFETTVPAFADRRQLYDLLVERRVTINARPPGERSLLETLLLGFGPTLLLVGFFLWLARRAAAQGPGGMLGQFGRARARRFDPSQQHVTFNDVAGIDEAKEELSEIVDFLRDPDKYRRLGARIPRGVLLSGPPGTGKTLLARAVAGEAGVPFFSISASEFIEAIVGVGASRVRDLFAQAKEAAPAIIFIDEIDAIGRSRAQAGTLGAHDEREQTLNQILTEMDGFDPAQGVIVLAATNRPEVLDPALLRPGRFDRRIVIQPPDSAGRRKILAVHTRSVPLADDVDLDELAQRTPGMVGADLANLVNEAALLAARRGHAAVTQADFDAALEKIVLGAERKMVLSEQDRRRVAYHEAGHALVAMLTPGADPLRKVSIIPRGRALGITFAAPEDDRFNYTRSELIAKIAVTLGGRAAEEVVFGDVSTGAEQDIEQVTELARRMVGRWGMGERVGLVAVLPRDGQGPVPFAADAPADATRRLLDEEVRRLVEERYRAVRDLLERERDRLERLARALLERETLEADEARRAAGLVEGTQASASVEVGKGEA